MRLGPEIAVPLDSASGALTVEPAVAMHDSVIVVSWNDSHGGHRERGRHDVGSAVSLDNGRSFRSLGFLADSSSTNLPVGGDSRLVSDKHGTFFLELVTNRSGGDGELHVYALEPPLYAKWKQLSIVTMGRIVDKPAFIRDAGGRLVLAFMKDWAIVTASSLDGGRSWTAPLRVSEATLRTRSGSAVVQCGNELWVAWMEGGGMLLDELWATRSRDAGRTFEPARMQYALLKTVQPPAGYALGPGRAGDLGNDVGLACVPGGGRSAQISMVIVEGAPDRYGRPILSRVLRFDRAVGAAQWSVPIELTKDDGPAARVFPSVAAERNTFGTLYYEAIADQSHTNVDAVLGLSDSRGQRSRVKLSEVSTDWLTVKGDNEYSPGQHNFGDYISLASDDGRYVAAWTDGREGRSRIHVRVIEMP